MYVFDLEYRITYANRALLKMWGKKSEDAVGKRLIENGYEPWHAEMHEREIDQVIANGQIIRGEVSFPHTTEGIRVYDYIFTPVFDVNGNVEAISGTTRDITERQHWQQSLKQNTEELQGINEELASTNENLRASNQELELVNEKLIAAHRKIEEGEAVLFLAINAANF